MKMHLNLIHRIACGSGKRTLGKALLAFLAGIALDAQATTIDVGGLGTIGDSTLTISGGVAFVPNSGALWAAAGGDGVKYSHLNSRTLTVPTAGTVTLKFSHRYNFEDAWDGGAVYVSVNGGTLAYVPDGSFSANGYVKVLDSSSYDGGPFPGLEKVFTGQSTDWGTPAYVESVATLGTFAAGDTIAIEFRGAWDWASNPAAPNWEISKVELRDSADTAFLNADFINGAAGFSVTSDLGLSGPWTYAGTDTCRFELDANASTADRFVPSSPGIIDLNNAKLEVAVLDGTLVPGQTFTLFNLAGGSSLQGTYGSITLPVGAWDLSGLQPGGNGQISLLASSTWLQTAALTYNWDDPLNWTDGLIPNSAGMIANMSIDYVGAQTINVNQQITVGAINLGDTTSSYYAVNIAPGQDLSDPPVPGALIMDATEGSAAITRTGGNSTVDLISANIVLNDNLVVSDATGQNNDGTVRGLRISGNITGGKSLTKSGNGAVFLTGSNDFSSVTVNSGYLGLGSANAIGTGSLIVNGAQVDGNGNASITLSNNNPLILNGDIRSHYGFNSGTGPITVNTVGIKAWGNVTLGGPISGPAGQNAFDIIYEMPNGMGGGWSLGAWPIVLRGTPELPTQTLQVNGWGPMWSQLTVPGVISDDGNSYGLNLTSGTGAARLLLTAANTFSGDTTVAAATPNNYIGVCIGNNLALQNSALVLTRPYSAAIASGIKTPTIGGLKGSQDLVTAFAAASFAWQDSYYNAVTSLTLNPGTGKTCTYSGAIANGAAGMTLVKAGAGTQELAGANTYTGNTSVDAGQLTLTETGSLTFKITDSGSNKLTGSGAVVLNGAFVFDRTTISVTSGTWTIVDATNVTYGPTFSVTGFTPDGSVWKLGGWTFNPASGLLTYAPKALITDFRYTDGSGTYVGVINQDAKTISLGPLPAAIDLSAFNPTFTLNSGNCDQTSGLPPAPTFAVANPATYTVTDGAVVNSYLVTAIVAPQPPNGVGTGLDLWLDASATYSLSITGSTVTEWRDARGGTAKATTTSGTPTLVASGINNIPTVHFNTSSWMNDGVNRAAGPVTIFYVSRQTGGANARVLGARSNNWLMGYHGNQSSRFYFEGWVYDAGPASNTNPHLFAATIGGSGQPSSVYAEGTLLASNTNGTQGPNNLELNGYSNGSELSNCDISEVLVYSRVLSSAELNAVGSYLTVKYGLTTSYSGPGEIVNMSVPGSTCVIDRVAKTIVLTVPYVPWYSTGLAALCPTYSLSSGTCDQPNDGVTLPTPTFAGGGPVTYTVTAGETVNAYSVTATVADPPIVFGATGTGVLTFDTIQPVNRWSTANIGGGGADITDLTGMNTKVNTLAAASITSQCAAIAGNPTGTAPLGKWNSVDLRLTTLPGSNAATVIMASVLNTSGAAVNRINLSFDLTGGGDDAELAGYVVYYSLTGAAGSWQQIGRYGTRGATATASDIVLTAPWANNAMLYVLWADDNGNGYTDNWYGIDNVVITKSATASPWDQWLADNAPGQTAAQDADHDGVPNGVEFFMGKTGSSFTANPSVVTQPGGDRTVTWPYVNAVSSFAVQVSDNLTDWSTAAPADVTIDGPKTGGTVTYKLPVGAKKFCRLIVIP